MLSLSKLPYQLELVHFYLAQEIVTIDKPMSLPTHGLRARLLIGTAPHIWMSEYTNKY